MIYTGAVFIVLYICVFGLVEVFGDQLFLFLCTNQSSATFLSKFHCSCGFV